MSGFNTVHIHTQTLPVCLLNCSPQTQELHEPPFIFLPASQKSLGLRFIFCCFFISLLWVDIGLSTFYFKVMREILYTVLVGTP